jgi:hypothetical protein
MRTIQTLSGVVLLVAVAVYLNFGTILPCGVLREVSRQRDSLAAVLPDRIVDLALSGQFGELSPGRCLAVLIGKPLSYVAKYELGDRRLNVLEFLDVAAATKHLNRVRFSAEYAGQVGH